ncbi:MAG: response regulator transcription factor [Sporolactobacillus sp.]
MAIRCWICDDQQLVREGMKMILSLHPDIDIVGESENGHRLLEQLTSGVVDVVLMDVRMPELDGIAATRLIKARFPELKVVILTTFDDDDYVLNALAGGADGYILKDSGSDEIVRAVHAAVRDHMLLNDRVAAKVVGALRPGSAGARQQLDVLTARELAVAREVACGKSNRVVGETLHLAEGTVKNYVSRILDKLELGSRAELIVLMEKANDRLP